MKTYICFILIMAAAPAMAAEVYLTAPDTMGQSSFNSGLHWSDGLAPSAGNNYAVSISQLRTPADGGSYTFAGDSLMINPGGVLMYKGTGTAGNITINYLIANGGSVIDHRNGAGDVCNLYGNIHIAADSVMYAKQGPINVYTAISGSGTITNPGTDGPGRTLTFYSAANTFTGSIVNNGRFVLADNAVLNFVIGTSWVNNSVSGTGPQTTFDGDFTFDLNGAGTTYGDSWQIASAAGQTFGSTFTVAGFVDIGEGFWVTRHNNGTFYQFSQSTGQLSIFWPGSGTPEDPYQIWTPQQMNTIGLYPEIWACHFRLMADIDMSAYTGTSYHIIGTSWDNPFTGTFDGNGHVITNLTVAAPSQDYVGLFGYVGSGGQILLLGVENVNINGGAAVGGLVGDIYYGNITSCYTTGSVSGSYAVGGLVGHNDSGTITSCYATGSVIGSSEFVGGLVGYSYLGTITSCYATGSVIGSADSVGGLVGYSYFGTITSCYATGSVSGYYRVGGLVGWDEYGTGTVTDCFWDTQTSGLLDSAGGIGKTTAEMQTISTFMDAGWDFTTKDGDPVDWRMPLSSYPKLGWEDYLPYCGDIDHPYPVMDFNQDCRVDLADFALFAAHWLECTAPECD